jgi:hypothetical protein
VLLHGTLKKFPGSLLMFVVVNMGDVNSNTIMDEVKRESHGWGL